MNYLCAMNQNDWLLQPLNNSVGRWLEEARRQLEPVSESPALESQMVMSFIVGQPRSWVIAHPEFVLSESDHRKTERLPEVCGGWLSICLYYRCA